MIRLVRLLLLVIVWPVYAAGHPPQAAIASAHPLATEAGFKILAEGGNAFDASVAVAAMLAVVEPASSGLGGGGFWLLHGADGKEVLVDARERAPLAAQPNMYQDDQGRVIQNASLDGPLAAGIPGVPAALVHVARRYGRLPLAQSLAPAIQIARQGFSVSAHYQRLAQLRRDVLAASPAAAGTFLTDGRVPELGALIRQPDLAETLTRLATAGDAGFYQGPIAKQLVEGVRAAGGIWTAQDLAEYRVIEREPLHGEYHGVRVRTAPPPSSGVILLQMLGLLGPYPLAHLEHSRRDHLVIEAMRLAYRDRARFLGDPDFVRVDIAHLLNPHYLDHLRRHIQHRATPSASLSGALPAAAGPHTTHFSILDREGNRVAATLSINGPFGAAFVPPGTGVLLNNEMDDFVAKPGVPNLYGLVGASANAIAPGKRPLSSMTPTFLETDDTVVALGTPGGSRIISMVLLATLDVAEQRGGPADWVARPRFHHQYLPDVVEYEPGALSELERRRLGRLGHTLKAVRPYGNMQIVVWDKRADRVMAASDPRGEGAAAVR
jgi:gamma-glutamyltranspeptidase/glutathione hydrolase